ncbi:glycosyl hydrolase family 61-domain-containing protein [Pseudomassariella vexata]|uniref:lytic cellulose monooxygenase (C4-dehydrogenating) n=1 Tax=Pseudomassariella vexata TaxID=1141098 RepID=A0A1Y2DHU4_9PEZI|nr:glycosyl hydrolase family 61-domain-containing protein [Pseudomassariella vexata]ORY58808.1 glycosyl hydrolase family 61-domain-containing protein [Pseudomassariella vexata]
MSFASKAALFGAFASAVLAHGTVSGIIADGVYSEGWQLSYYYSIQNGQTYPDTPGWYAEDLDNGFIAPDAYAEADIICHKNAKNSNSSATVAAGGSVDFQWTAWPDSHIGPIFTYVANCGADCGTVDKSTLKWVKIDEAGIDLDTQTWPTTGMIANNNTWTTTVPSTLAAGKYVFRHEIIAMHGAGSENGAQNYPQCSNIEITGSGTDSPEGTLGTALYTSTDPGILFNPYTTLTEYTIPGPALYSGATGTSGGGASGSSSSAPVATSSVPAVSSVFPSATSAPATVASHHSNSGYPDAADRPTPRYQRRAETHP